MIVQLVCDRNILVTFDSNGANHPQTSFLGNSALRKTTNASVENNRRQLKNKLHEVVEQLSPTTYSPKDPETGKLKQRPAHVTQIARVRFLGTHIVDERESDDAGVAQTPSRAPLHEQTQSQKWARRGLRAGADCGLLGGVV